MFNLKEYIKEKRPNLSESSITTYNSILKNLYKKVFGKEEIEPKDFDNSDKIIAFIKDIPPNKRKSILSSLVIITDKKAYRDLMLEDISSYREEIAKQEKTDSQEEGWVSKGEIETLWNSLKRNADLLYKKETISPADLQQIQNFVLLSVCGGILSKPRRSKDWTAFKIKNVDKSKDNFMDKGVFHFNNYKTSKFYGEQTEPISKELKSILTKWLKVNPTEYLFFDTNGSPLSSVKLNQRFNKMFGSKTSVNIFRHSYLSTKYADTIGQNKKMADDLRSMGSSMSQATTYIKKD